jgi:hypothetical protein
MNINKCSQTLTLQGTLKAISRFSSIPPVTTSRNYRLKLSTDQVPGVVIRVHTTKACVRTGGLTPRTLTTALDGREMVGWVGPTTILDVSGKGLCPLSKIKRRFRGRPACSLITIQNTLTQRGGRRNFKLLNSINQEETSEYLNGRSMLEIKFEDMANGEEKLG